MGWVSIIHDRDIKKILRLPAHVSPVAYLCVGYVTHFPEKPELEAAGWLPRVKLEDLVFCEQWAEACGESWPELNEELNSVREM